MSACRATWERPPCLHCGGELGPTMSCKACGMPHIIPQPGPQSEYVKSRAIITVMGGARGGGKTHGTFMRPVFMGGSDMGALDDPRFTGTFFRKEQTSMRGPGKLWDKAKGFYQPLGGVPNERDMVLTFPSGAKIQFSGCDNMEKHRGNEYLWVAIEEATQLDWRDFMSLMKCNRPSGGCSIPPWIDLTCNPDPESWVFRLIDWWIWPEGHELAGFPRADRIGKLRYFTMDEDKVRWIDTFFDGDPADWRDEDGIEAVSVTFVPSTVEDNPALMDVDKRYKSKLAAQTYVEQMKELHGNWLASDRNGIFARSTVRWIEPGEVPEDLKTITYWDLAATDRKGKEEFRNATAGSKCGLHTCVTCGGWRYVSESEPCPDCNVRYGTDEPFVLPEQVPEAQQILIWTNLEFGELGPGDVRKLVRETALRDGVKVPVYFEQESAASGVSDMYTYQSLVLPEFQVHGDKPQGAKETRARNLAALGEMGLLWIVRDISTQKLINNALREFPRSGRDIIDSAGGCERVLREHDWNEGFFF